MPGPSTRAALIAAAACTIASAEETAALPTAPLQKAFMIIAGGGPTREEGQAKLERYRRDGFPSHDAYPALLLSTGVQGLKPGFWIVVAGVARDRQVADRAGSQLMAGQHRPESTRAVAAMTAVLGSAVPAADAGPALQAESHRASPLSARAYRRRLASRPMDSVRAP